MSRTGVSGRASRLRDGVRLAAGTLTVLPVRPPGSVDRRAGAVAMTVAPLVGLLLAVVIGVLLWLLGLGPKGTWTPGWDGPADLGLHPPSPLLAAAVTVAVLAVLTRGIHLDGLADTADGLGSGRPADEALAVMRRGDVGPFGVVTVVLVLLVQVAALAQLLTTGGGVLALGWALVVSRAVLPLACRRGVPAARPDGIGRAVAGSVGVRGLLLSWALGVVGFALYAGVVALGSGLLHDGVLSASSWTAPSAGTLVDQVVVAALGLAAGWALVRRCVHRFGGVTGDVLGAAVEVTLTVVLLFLAVL